MVGPHIVPDSKPPVFLLTMGAAVVAGLIIRALRRRHRRAATARGVEVSSTGRRVRQPTPTSSRAKPRTPALLPATTVGSASVKGTRAVVREE